MSNATSIFLQSHEKLTELRNTAQARSSGSLKLVVPEPSFDSPTKAKKYINDAISMLSEASRYSFDCHFYSNPRFDSMEKKLDSSNHKNDSLSTYVRVQFDDISRDITQIKGSFKRKFNGAQHRFELLHKDLKETKEDLRDLREDLKDVKEDVKEVEEDLKEIKKGLEGIKEKFKDVENNVCTIRNEVGALARNRLISKLLHPIAKVSALIPDDNGVMQHLVSPDFPLTIRRFWLLESNGEQC